MEKDNKSSYLVLTDKGYDFMYKEGGYKNEYEGAKDDDDNDDNEKTEAYKKLVLESIITNDIQKDFFFLIKHGFLKKNKKIDWNKKPLKLVLIIKGFESIGLKFKENDEFE